MNCRHQALVVLLEADPAASRIAAWTAAVAAAQQLADEAADWLAAPVQDALPL